MAKAVKKSAKVAIQQLEELKEHFSQSENTYAVGKCSNIIATLKSDVQEVEFEEEPAITLEHVDPKDTLPLGTTDKIDEIANNDAFVSTESYQEEDVHEVATSNRSLESVQIGPITECKAFDKNCSFTIQTTFSWDFIFDEFFTNPFPVHEVAEIQVFLTFLKENYNPPTPKQKE